MKKLVVLAVSAAGLSASRAGDLPESVRALRQAGPLQVELRTNAGHDVSLHLETAYSTQTLGERLTSGQISALETVRHEAPDKFEILQTLYPRQIAEFLLRSETDATVAPSDDPVQRLMLEIAGEYLTQPMGEFTDAQKNARHEFLQSAMEKLPPQFEAMRKVLESASHVDDPDFGSPTKAQTLATLQNQYSPYQPVRMSLAGDTFALGGKIVTEHLTEEAAAARRTPEELAHARYDALCRALAHWRAGQITGNAYAGTIKTFLDDPRLASFTPAEVHRAYHRVFGRDLKTDLEADRVAAQVGHPVTYNDLASRHP